jgi:hypothetical protein
MVPKFKKIIKIGCVILFIMLILHLVYCISYPIVLMYLLEDLKETSDSYYLFNQ